MASFSQESQRFCNYSKDKFNKQITVIKPYWLEEGTLKEKVWFVAVRNLEEDYFTLLDMGAKPEEARDILPNCTKTELVVTMNLRSWMHFFTMRCNSHAQREVRGLALKLLSEFNSFLPEVFDTILIP